MYVLNHIAGNKTVWRNGEMCFAACAHRRPQNAPAGQRRRRRGCAWQKKPGAAIVGDAVLRRKRSMAVSLGARARNEHRVGIKRRRRCAAFLAYFTASTQSRICRQREARRLGVNNISEYLREGVKLSSFSYEATSRRRRRRAWRSSSWPARAGSWLGLANVKALAGQYKGV